MPEIAALFHRDGRAAGRELLERNGAGGPSIAGGRTWCRGSLALAVSPETSLAPGDHRSVVACDPEALLHLAFDGHLDNRDELATELDLVASRTSDAALLLSAWCRWGEELLEHLVGSFAFVLAEPSAERLVCGRDALGDRTLCYFLDATLFLAASQEATLLAQPEVDDELDEVEIARFLAWRAPGIGATMFRRVREVPPGHLLIVGRERVRTVRGWFPERLPERIGEPDERLIEEYGDLLTRAVAASFRRPAETALLLSGGLDSTAIAVAARRALGRPAPLSAISWSFEDLPSCDERVWIRSAAEATRFDVAWTRADGFWPLRGGRLWEADPNTPDVAIFMELVEKTFDAARARGARTVVSGQFGDHLFEGVAGWLSDLVRSRRLPAAICELAGQAARSALPRSGRPKVRARTAVARALGIRSDPIEPPVLSVDWLTPYATALLAEAGVEDWPPRAADAAHRSRLRFLCRLEGARTVSRQSAYYRRRGIDLRFPHRDRRLVEWAATAPDHLLYRPGRPKWAARQWLRGRVPEALRKRPKTTTQHELAVLGFARRERETLERSLATAEALWPKFVSADWLRSVIETDFANHFFVREGMVAWLCLCLEVWRSAAQRVKIV